MTKHRGLGRGLDQLIPPGAPTLSSVLSAPPVHEVPVAAVTPNPLQPRTHFDPESLQDLARSITEYGVLQPLVVEPDGGGYRLVAGERRLRASQLAGLTHVPVVIRPAGADRARLEMALVENIQRRDISALDEARAFTRLCDEFGMTQEAVAQQVGRSRSAVTNTMRLLQATPPVQQALEDERISPHMRERCSESPTRASKSRLSPTSSPGICRYGTRRDWWVGWGPTTPARLPGSDRYLRSWRLSRPPWPGG